MHTYTHTHIHTHIHTYTHAYIHTYIHTYMAQAVSGSSGLPTKTRWCAKPQANISSTTTRRTAQEQVHLEHILCPQSGEHLRLSCRALLPLAELAWLPPRVSGGNWGYFTANLLCLFVLGAPVSALFLGLQDAFEVPLHLTDDGLSIYLMVPELCHMSTQPMYELDLAGQAQARHQMPPMWHMVACSQGKPRRHGQGQRTRSTHQDRSNKASFLA